MFIDIEDNSPAPVEGYCYTNRDGSMEYVRLGTANQQFGDTIYIEDNLEQSCEIYTKDIPKLIKALQAAYNHKGKP